MNQVIADGQLQKSKQIIEEQAEGGACYRLNDWKTKNWRDSGDG